MEKLQLLILKCVLRLCAVLPLSVARALGRYAVYLYWPVGGRSRKVTEVNIAAAFPDMTAQEQRKLSKASLAATAEVFTEMGHIWLKPWESVAKLIVEEHGVDIIREAQAQGRGIIAMSPHLGNWEVMGLHAATLGHTVSLYQPPKLAGLEAMIRTARQNTGAQLVPTNSRGLATMLRNVKGGGISGMLPDQAPADLASGINSEFMGIECFTGTLACNLIRRTGALAVYGYARRVPGGFVVCYEKAEDAIYDKDDVVSLAAMNRGVEHCLRSCVEQYQWEYKRFRVRPRNGPGLYDNM